MITTPIRPPSKPPAPFCPNRLYPIRVAGQWQMDMGPLAPALDGYFERTNRFVHETSYSASIDGDTFLTNEEDYPAALGAIADRGGAYVGVGELMSFTYPAWQGAHHAYAVDRNRDIPLGFVPMYGALLAMAQNRLEFLSLVSGRPIPQDLRSSPPEGTDYEELIAIAGLYEHDAEFFDIVTAGLTTAIASRLPEGARRSTDHAVRTWMKRFRNDLAFPKPKLMSEGDWLSYFWNSGARLKLLGLADGQGRGGTLASEEAFQRERELFLEGRITGVAASLGRGGFELVRAAMGEDEASVVYLSNVEHMHHQNLINGSEPGLEEKLLNFYAGLNDLPGAAESLLISADGRRPTVVSDLMESADAVYPIGMRAGEGALAFRALYPLRSAVLKQLDRPLDERIRALFNYPDIDPLLQRLLTHAASIFHGQRPLRYDEAMGGLIRECPPFATKMPPQLRTMFMSNLILLGVVEEM